MATFARRRSPAAAWSVDDASTFAALKEFKLLQLLSADKKALATARRLGVFSAQPQPQQARTARSTASRTAPHVPSDAASGVAAVPNARKRRSAARSAQHHAQRQLQLYRTGIAVLYLCRLRRRCRARRLRAHLADLESLEGPLVSGNSGDPPLSCSCALRANPSSKRAYALSLCFICLLVCGFVRLLQQCSTARRLLSCHMPACAAPAQCNETAAAKGGASAVLCRSHVTHMRILSIAARASCPQSASRGQ